MSSVTRPPNRPAATPLDARRRGVTAVLAMMFLLIFGSLAAAMAIVSQGNLRTADSHLKINRAMAVAETGMDLMAYRLEQVTQGDLGEAIDMDDEADLFSGVRTSAGLIDDGAAYDLWTKTNGIADKMVNVLTGHPHYVDPLGSPFVKQDLGVHRSGNTIHQLVVPAIAVGTGGQAFSATMTPHDLPADLQPSALGYDDPFYDRLPYGPPGGDPNGNSAERNQHELDMRIKREAGIDFIVGETYDDGSSRADGLETRPLDARFVRVRVTAYDGALNGDPRYDPDSAQYDAALTSQRRVYRSIEMDFRLDKTVPYAVLSRSRIMIGRNVSIEGNVGSRFNETDKENGHPVQVQSDFLGLNSALDAQISPPSAAYPAGGTFHNEIVTSDIDGDNRLAIDNPTEIQDWPGGELGARSSDADGDGYLTAFDLFLAEFDNNPIDGRVSQSEFISNADQVNDATATQLFFLLDAAGVEQRTGYEDGYIDGDDRYAKISGRVSITASLADWNAGLNSWGDVGGTATPDYKDYFQGAVRPDFGDNALTTADPDLERHNFDQHSFDTSSFHALADGDVIDGQSDVGSNNGSLAGEFVLAADRTDDPEPVPYDAEYPYDYYERPIYRNKEFIDARIEVGTNALFENCRFIGVTYIVVDASNYDENFNYVGMQESDGTDKHPDFDAEVDGTTVTTDDDPSRPRQNGTKRFGNNIRFHNCKFEGPVVSGTASGTQPAGFTHVRNKVTFTGKTQFDFENGTTEDERRLYERSSLLLPHMSVEMGSFNDGATTTTDIDGNVTGVTSDEELKLSGAVVAGLIDMRGNIELRGTLITTFEPVSGVAPVQGDTAPQFNTTLGYFSQGQGDLEAALPTSGGLGQIRLIYDPTLALPDGIDGPVELRPLTATYFESGR
ncbi:MAG: hypothetical protein AAFX76_00800 [Planctomycetota bacterium]